MLKKGLGILLLQMMSLEMDIIRSPMTIISSESVWMIRS